MSVPTDWVALGWRAILQILDDEHAVVWPEVEARLSDTIPRGFSHRIDPHHLTTARRQLRAAGIIEEITAPTRGGREVEVIARTNRQGRQRAFEDAAARKRLLYARYLGWAERIFGRAGEQITHASLLAAAPYGFRLVQPDGGQISHLFDQRAPVGPLDNAAILQCLDRTGRPAGSVVVLIEVKNVRHWIYAESPELFELLDKAAQLQLANPDIALLPVLVCRRAHPTAFRMAKELGFFIADARAQFVLPLAEVPDQHLLEIQQELAFADLTRTDKAYPRLVSLFANAVADCAKDAADRFARSAPVLARYAPVLRTHSPGHSAMRLLRSETQDLRDRGGW